VFEKDLGDKFKRIFDLPKVTFDQPGQSEEQGCLFVDIDKSRHRVKDGRVIGRVEGTAYVYDTGGKLPFAYFSKQIAKADAADTKDLFFFDMETNEKGFLNVVKRGFGFVYLFNSQYDPEIGTITSIEFDPEEENA